MIVVKCPFVPTAVFWRRRVHDPLVVLILGHFCEKIEMTDLVVRVVLIQVDDQFGCRLALRKGHNQYTAVVIVVQRSYLL